MKSKMSKSTFATFMLSVIKQKIHVFSRTITIFLLAGFLLLRAEDFSYAFHVDKTEPYVKETVILTLELWQTNPNKVLMFDFDLLASKNYTFQRLDAQETDNHPNKRLHAAKVKYVYLLHALSSGKVDLHFKLLKKATSDASIAYSFSGDRDNVKTLITNDTPISLPPLSLQVKTLPQGTQIVGDFSLEYYLKKHKAKAHEPLSFQVTIKGLGYPPLLDLIPKDVNFTVFTDKPLLKSKASIQGIYSTVHHPMALSNDNNFTLPSIELKAFNPKTQKPYILSVPQQKFDITAVSKNDLLDKTNSPNVLKHDWLWPSHMLTYLFVFIAGILTALSWKWTKKIPKDKNNPLINKVKNAKDAKALLQVLLANDSHHFSKNIEILENCLYADAKIKINGKRLNKIKQEVMDIL